MHGLASLLIAKPDFPWPPTEQLVEQVIEVHGAGLAARGLGPVPRIGPLTRATGIPEEVRVSRPVRRPPAG